MGDLDKGDAAAAAAGAATGAVAGAMSGGPPGAIVGAAAGAVRGVVGKKAVENLDERQEHPAREVLDVWSTADDSARGQAVAERDASGPRQSAAESVREVDDAGSSRVDEEEDDFLLA